MKKYTKEDLEFIKEYYPKYGMSYCLENLKLNKSTIKGICHRNKIKRPEDPRKALKPKIEDFKNVIKPEVAYLLGLLWADGCLIKDLTAIVLIVNKYDAEHYLRIISNLGHFYPTVVKKTKEHLDDNTGIFIYSKEFGKYFETLGFREKSHCSPKRVLDTIPDKLKRFFFLGFIDGDGSWRGRKLSMCATYDYPWEEFINFVKEMNSTYYHHQTSTWQGKVSTLSVFSLGDCVNIGTLLYKTYQEDKIGLPRKYEDFQLIVQQNQKRLPNKTGYRGVTKTGENKYKVYINFEGREKTQSCKSGFSTAEEAALYYDLEAIKLWGHRAKTNFPITNYIEIGFSEKYS